MGICESSINNKNKEEATKGDIENENNSRKYPYNMHQTNFRYDESKITDNSNPLTKLESNPSKILPKEIKIKLEAQDKTIRGRGFLLFIPLDLGEFYCFMTNDHVINNESINNNNIIYIIYEEYKVVNIKLDRNKRYIRNFKDINLDITVVQILDKDNIPKDYFLEPEFDIQINNNLINKKIYIPQYIVGKKFENAEGIITDINGYEFSHSVDTDNGPGSPIFLKTSNRVIGIHYGYALNKNINYGDFIYPTINMIKEDIKKNEIF